MPLEPGTTLGPYAVTAKIGEGGMGEVWQARDTKLDRDVALKVLPEAFTADPDRLARFEREAKVLASLNHPNIGSIYGLEEAEGIKALVLELVEGPTLADRIKQGPIPIDEALPIAKQIAEALEAAHEAGVIHRDLKPANIKVREDGTVKVLDFGLAKALDPNPEGDPSQSPTLTAAATQMGVIMGTAAYMSPEQAKGKVADRRSDVWAFGAVLYEMLAGRRAFVGDDVSDTLVSVFRDDPDWSALRDDVSPSVRQTIQVCLQKDPKQRVRDIAAVRLAMEGAFETTVGAPSEPAVPPKLQIWQRPVPLLAGLVLIAVSGLVGRNLASDVPALQAPLARFALELPTGEGLTSAGGVAISPDGSRWVYAGERDGARQLFVRDRGQFEAVALRGTEGARHPFFSPDGEWVGFFTAGDLKRVSLAGGRPLTLVGGLGRVRGAAWGPDDTIVFASSAFPGLMQVSSAGGEPQSLTSPEGQTSHLWPTYSPDGAAVLFTVREGGPDGTVPRQVAVLSLETGQQRILTSGNDPHIAASGHLVFAREASLWAAAFDPVRLELSGDPVPMVEDVQINPGGWAHYDLATDGTLIYLPSGATAAVPLVIVDRAGRATPLSADPDAYAHPQLSPDGRYVAVDTPSGIWVVDVERGTRVLLAPQGSQPTWTADGTGVTFGTGTAMLQRPADASADATTLLPEDGQPMSWSPDGDTLAFVQSDISADVWTLRRGDEPELFRGAEAQENGPAFSPDGRWIAYTSDESGRQEVYVEPYPGPGAREPISAEGGSAPVWSSSGDELFYRMGSAVLKVPIETEAAFSAGRPEVLFTGPYIADENGHPRYDVFPDGERFLMVATRATSDASGALPGDLMVVLNWFEELLERVPLP